MRISTAKTMHKTAATTNPIPSRAQLRRGLLAEAHDSPSMEQFRTPTARRRLIALHLFLSGILITVPELLFLWSKEDPAVPGWGFAAAAVVLYLPWMFVTGMVNGSVGGIFDLKTMQLDELERRDRDAAYRTAYRVLIPLAMVLCGAVGGLTAAGRGALAFWCCAALLFVQLGLPQYIAAWRLAARQDADAAFADTDAHGA
jgi:hypothetical protein